MKNWFTKLKLLLGLIPSDKKIYRAKSLAYLPTQDALDLFESIIPHPPAVSEQWLAERRTLWEENVVIDKHGAKLPITNNFGVTTYKINKDGAFSIDIAFNDSRYVRKIDLTLDCYTDTLLHKGYFKTH